ACSDSGSASSSANTPPPDAGSFVVLVGGRSHPHALALHDKWLYWIEADAKGTVMRMPTTGGAPAQVTDGCAPYVIAVDDALVLSAGLDKSIRATSIANGATNTLTTDQPVSGLALDTKNAYWTTYYGLRADGANYTTSLLSVPVGGGALTALATKQPLASSV